VSSLAWRRNTGKSFHTNPDPGPTGIFETGSKSHPGTQLQIVSTLWPEDNKLAEVDIEIRYGSWELAGEGAELLFADHILPVCVPEKLPQQPTAESMYRNGLIRTVGASDNLSMANC
jgi:hypothetical protein